MRRIDAVGICLGVFIVGGGAYVVLQLVGFDNLEAGIWSQLLLVGGLVGWVATYVLRAVNQKMTYNQQRQDYEEAYFQKLLDELSPEELAKIQAEVEQERVSAKDASQSQV